MLNRGELGFLREVFEKSGVSVTIFDEEDLKGREGEGRSWVLDNGKFFSKIFPALEHKTVYKTTDSFECVLRFLLLPDFESPTVLCIGPYLERQLSDSRRMEIGEASGASLKKQRYLEEYYSGLPILTENSPLLIMFDVFCSKLWGKGQYEFKDIVRVAEEQPFTESMSDAHASETLINMKAIERRYSFENELMRAVSSGQTNMEERFKLAISMDTIEKRVSDPVRNLKNYSIIMNTLLRKAAEEGGVHPIYIDKVSSEFAKKIENITSAAENSALMSEMFRTYCRLVRGHSVKSYSEIVRRAMLIIDSDLSAELSCASIADSLGVSLGYLSATFSKETGKTLSEYVRHRRMKHAAYLLASTSLQVQTVALHCGIMDVQYFAKLFKREFGKSPTEYRRSRGAGKEERAK